jgi:hypothetical protein
MIREEWWDVSWDEEGVLQDSVSRTWRVGVVLVSALMWVWVQHDAECLLDLFVWM